MTQPTIAAEYYDGGKRAGKFVDIVQIGNGWRKALKGPFPVSGKREARKVAAAHNATPWNF
jgi:hypothetical protein